MPGAPGIGSAVEPPSRVPTLLVRQKPVVAARRRFAPHQAWSDSMVARIRVLIGAATLVVLLMTGRRNAISHPTPAVRPPGAAPAALKSAGGGVRPRGVAANPIRRNVAIGIDPSGDRLRVRYDAAGNPVSVHLSKSIEQLQAGRARANREVRMMPGLGRRSSRAFASSSPDPISNEPSSLEGSGAAWVILRILRPTSGRAGSSVVWELHTNGPRNPGVAVTASPGS